MVTSHFPLCRLKSIPQQFSVKQVYFEGDVEFTDEYVGANRVLAVSWGLCPPRRRLYRGLKELEKENLDDVWLPAWQRLPGDARETW